MNAQEQLLTTRLKGFAAPGEVEAGERGRRLVLAAFAERAPVRRRRFHLPRVVWPVLAALLAASAVAVAGYLRDGGGSPRQARAPFGAEVEDGVVLALGRGIASTVNARGRIRALGPASDGDLSPHGRNAVLASGSGLVAVNVADGQVRWRVPAPARVSLPRWSRERTVPPCCRVAYLAGGALYAVGGDGRGAHLVARHALAVAPAWRPGGAAHELAYAAPDGIHIVAADSRHERAHLPGPAPLALSWRADGRTLAVLDATGVTLYSASGKRLQRLAAHGGVLAGGYAPAGNRLVVLRRGASGRVSLLVRGASGLLRAVRHLTLTAVGDLRLSPDGRSALVASREGDEWVEIR
ncbi:MAG TPA: hypothetical protein VK546_06765, partial [Gaiellales bacterium]|nr:hypothetical protein [Gaiellales bacterium]